MAAATTALGCWASNSPTCIVAIDVGHSESAPGAISARGVSEYTFNREVAGLLLERLKKAGMEESFIVEAPGDQLSLAERTKVADRRNASFFLSIHHDSVQPSYLVTWKYENVERLYSDRFRGFSLFISKQGPRSAENLALARSIGTQLLNLGFQPSLHHAEKIRGESRELLDRRRGIFAFDDLIVLKTATMPAVLIECGVIVNRDEELRLRDQARQDRFVTAVVTGISKRCAASRHRTSEQ
ncbi:MAG TPA: N-acetylmuramoyl-L-alanine amidase [Bryobacteraceae bacterium]